MIMTEMGEFLVGAWLKVVQKCDFIQYNDRLPGGGLKGLAEVDVIGLNLTSKEAYLCEVTTHLRGLGYVDYPTTIEKLRTKFESDKKYADEMLKAFPTRHYMFWSPVVPEGKLITLLDELKKELQRRLNLDLELVINRQYAERVDQLKNEAHDKNEDTGNPAFRLLQILGHLKQESRVSL